MVNPSSLQTQVINCAYRSRRREKRPLALLKYAAFAIFAVTSIALLVTRVNGFYGTHIGGWHEVTVKPGMTLYSYAAAANVGYVTAVESAIQKHNGLKTAKIYAGQALWIPDGGNK